MPHTSILDYWIIVASAFATLHEPGFSKVLWQGAGRFEMFFHGSPQLLLFRLQGQVQGFHLICFLRMALRWILKLQQISMWVKFQTRKTVEITGKLRQFMASHEKIWAIRRWHLLRFATVAAGTFFENHLDAGVASLQVPNMVSWCIHSLITYRWRPYPDEHMPRVWRRQIAFGAYSTSYLSLDWFKGASSGNHGVYH